MPSAVTPTWWTSFPPGVTTYSSFTLCPASDTHDPSGCCVRARKRSPRSMAAFVSSFISSGLRAVVGSEPPRRQEHRRQRERRERQQVGRDPFHSSRI